ncbi:DUF6292 family protein [Actinosynnema sp. NPDC020468]|uniref:DUF6292 family protein n=1 Tax=Actinosynnema sp. NPDC020468 TaxID=3154488 RepID=UPI003400C6F7
MTDTETLSAHDLTAALYGYVRVVAEAVGVPPEGATCEVTDTVTAYLALGDRDPAHPDRDLMLVWNERQGWVVLVETNPGEEQIVLSRQGGDLVPAPDEVVRFVADALARRRDPAPTTPPPRVARAVLARLMAGHAY